MKKILSLLIILSMSVSVTAFATLEIEEKNEPLIDPSINPAVEETEEKTIEDVEEEKPQILLEHNGTDISEIEIGTKQLGSRVKEFIPLFQQAGDQYGVDPNILAAICMQESSGVNYSYKEDGTPYDAWGIMQIATSMVHDFAAFGLNTTGVEWTSEDRLDPTKAIPYAANLISKYVIYYDADYAKVIQGYNFGQTVTNKLIEAKGEDWLSERVHAVEYAENWERDTFGDPLYLEHVLRYYHTDIPYSGAKVRVNGELVSFKDQFPIIVNDRTLIPVRGVLEKMGAKVSWDADKYQVKITRNRASVVLPINSNTVYVNGAAQSIEVPATIINDRTMVPIRFIADTYGVQIEWHQPSRTVQITVE